MTMRNNTHDRDYVTDYLIPVISLMRKKINHTEAFKEIAVSLRLTTRC